MLKEYDNHTQLPEDNFLAQIHQDFLRNPYSRLLTYEVDKNIVGYLFYSEIYERLEIEQFEVEKIYRGQGIGGLLLQELIKKAKSEKKMNITLEVRESNKAALSLYQKFGFREVALRKDYYQTESALLMELTIETK